MSTARRSATFADPPEILWATVGDPHHLPRWWPGVQRVEDVDPGSFTQVLENKGGKTVRADYAMVEQTEPTRCRWRRKPVGTPVERLLKRAEVTVELAAEGGGSTKVTLTLRQAPGAGRLGAGRRPGRAELDEALAELGRIHA